MRNHRGGPGSIRCGCLGTSRKKAGSVISVVKMENENGDIAGRPISADGPIGHMIAGASDAGALFFVTNLRMSPTVAKDGDTKNDLKTTLSPTSPT